jgi:hypothetical protein
MVFLYRAIRPNPAYEYLRASLKVSPASMPFRAYIKQ